MTLPKGVTIKKCESWCQNNFSEPGTYIFFIILDILFYLCLVSSSLHSRSVLEQSKAHNTDDSAFRFLG